MGQGRSSNDDRSDRYNPNNDAYWAAEANEANQRGDDDWDEFDSDAQPSTGVPSVSIDSCRINLDWPKNYSPREKSWSDREPQGGARRAIDRCGPKCLDRLSRWLNLMRSMLEIAMDLQVQSAPDLRYQRALIEKRETMAAVAKTLKRLHSKGKTLSPEMRASVHEILSLREGGEAPESAVEEVLAAWGLLDDGGRLSGRPWEEIASGGTADRDPYGELSLLDVPWLLEGAHNPERFSAETVTLSWHETFDRIGDSLTQCLASIPDGTAVLSIKSNPYSKEAPSHRPDSSEDDRHSPWSVDIRAVDDETATSEILATAENKHRYDEPDHDVLMVPGGASRRMSVAAVEQVVRGAHSLVSALPESAQPIPVLNAMVAAALRAEWAGASHLVFGLRFDPLGKPRLAAPCAHDAQEAARLERALLRRGYRSVTLPVHGDGRRCPWEAGTPEDGRVAEYSRQREGFVLQLPDLK